MVQCHTRRWSENMFLEDVDKHTKQTNITTHVLTSSDGEVLCVDHDIHKRLGLQLPSWRGKHLSAYIPGFGTQQECVRTLQKRAEDTQESPLTGDTSHSEVFFTCGKKNNSPLPLSSPQTESSSGLHSSASSRSLRHNRQKRHPSCVRRLARLLPDLHMKYEILSPQS